MPFDVAQALLRAENSKKRRRYLLLLYSSKTANESDIKAIELAVDRYLKEFVIVRLEDPDEALKILIIKNIEVTIIDKSFLESSALTIQFAYESKRRKKCPLFFVTGNEQELIREYKKSLYMYEEMDDYLIPPLDIHEMGRRLKRVGSTQTRNAKRYQVGVPVILETLNTDYKLEGMLTDISLVGFGLRIEDESQKLLRGEQIRMTIPLRTLNFFHPQYGDILNLSGRIKRFSIDGTRVGCAFEHINPAQNACLLKVIELLAKRKNATKRPTKEEEEKKEKEANAKKLEGPKKDKKK